MESNAKSSIIQRAASARAVVMRQFAAEAINIADRIVRLMEAVKDDALAWTDPGMVVLQDGTAFTEAMADLADYALDAASKAELAAQNE